VIAVAVGLGALSTSSAQERPGKPGQPPIRIKSLYDRLGGTYAIAAVVDDYIDNLVKDPVVMANPRVKAAVGKAAAGHGVPGLKYQITAFFIEASGGPDKYHGGTMKDTHATLNITHSEWEASAAVLKATLDKFKVPAPEQGELFALVESTHEDIVVHAGHDDHPHKPAPAPGTSKPRAR
jgi:hemoglobin